MSFNLALSISFDAMCATVVSIRHTPLCSENIYTTQRRKAPLPLRFGTFMGRHLNFSAGREYTPDNKCSTYSESGLRWGWLSLQELPPGGVQIGATRVPG